MAEATRLHPLDKRRFAAPGISLEPAPPADRLILRVGEKDRGAIAEALGTALPGGPKTSASRDGLSVLWLGPDEWLVLADEGADPGARLSAQAAVHSVVDISHRNTAILVAGEHADTVIAAGCPQDLSLTTFPPGACSRTILAKAEIVLYRQAPDQFRVECWRSFSDYVWRFLAEAAKSVQ